MVIAWRAWTLDEHPVTPEVDLPHAHGMAWRLMSTNNDSEHAVWEPQQRVAAKCLLGLLGKVEPHTAPDQGCRCGYYGYSTVEDCLLAMAPHEARVDVVGKVKLSGRIIRVGETYRAEFAYPERLILIEWPWRNTADKARELGAYGVAVEVRPHPEGLKEPAPQP